jgi:hypothetical protein
MFGRPPILGRRNCITIEGERAGMEWIVWITLVGGGVLGLWLLWEWWRSRELHDQPPPGRVWSAMPAPGEIWWGRIPYARGFGSKDRPCLVVRTHATSVRVLMITSQDKSRRSDHVMVPRSGTGQKAGQDRWVDLATLISVSNRELRKREGTCDERTWGRVTRTQRPGWAYKVSLDRRSWWDAERRTWSPLATNDGSAGRGRGAVAPREGAGSRPRARGRSTDVGCGLRVRVGRGERIVIVDVGQGSVAERAGLHPGFTITMLGGYTNFTVSNLQAALGRPDQRAQLTVRRNGDDGGDLTVTLAP